MIDDEDEIDLADGVEAFFCDENHLHVVLKQGDEDIAGIALELEEGIELVQDLLQQIEEMTGLVFLMADPTEVEIDTIGETMGNA